MYSKIHLKCTPPVRVRSEPVNHKLGGYGAAMAISSADSPILDPSIRHIEIGDRTHCDSRAELAHSMAQKMGGSFPTFSGPDQLLPPLMLLWKRGHLARDQRRDSRAISASRIYANVWPSLGIKQELRHGMQPVRLL